MEQRSLPTVSGQEAWRLVAPWLGYVVIGVVGMVGLFAGSRTGDAAGSDAGVLCFFLAVALIAWRIHRQTGGAQDGVLLNLQVKDSDELLLAIAIFGVLGIVGLIFAGVGDGVFRYAGLVFFICCAVLIFLYVKGYFDHAEIGDASGVSQSADQKAERTH